MPSLRIAQLTSVSISVPPRSHGGTEWVVYHVVEGLHRHGHRVELFASGDSRVSCPVHSVTPTALLYRPDWSVYLERDYEAMNTHNVYRQEDRFDVVHAHWPTTASFFSRPDGRPLVVTYQYVSRELLDYYETHFPWVHGVFVSRAQAAGLGRPDAPVVHNGVDVDAIPFVAEPDDDLVIVGRMTPNKGIADAVRIARAAGRRLTIVAPVVKNLEESRPYFEKHVLPLIDGHRVRYLPDLPNEETIRLMGRCRAFLFPLQWEEPFGMAVAEAMAAGTPVVAYRRGSMPELIRHGETGFLCDSEDEMVEALGWVDDLDRWACREWAADRFGLERLVSDYERRYDEVLAVAR